MTIHPLQGTGDPEVGRRQHTCLLFKNSLEEKQYVLPFLKEGLDSGEHCLFVCTEDSIEDWSAEMRAFGIDVDAHIESGALAIATGEQWRESPFDSIIKARELWQHIDEHLTRFSGVRIVGDAIWAQIAPPIAADRLCHWEATADLIYEDVPVKTVCMYDLNLHSPAEIRAALRTHATAVVDGVARHNPYYEAVKILNAEPDLNASDADPAMIERMLGILRGGS
jgi:hypothetical protein